MTTYNITAHGIDMGDYSEPSEARAVHAYASSLGYSDVTDAAETLGQTVETFLADLVITEVEEYDMTPDEFSRTWAMNRLRLQCELTWAMESPQTTAHPVPDLASFNARLYQAVRYMEPASDAFLAVIDDHVAAWVEEAKNQLEIDRVLAELDCDDYQVNAHGLEVIAEALATYHIPGASALGYALDVEDSLNAGNPAQFEIKAHHALDGKLRVIDLGEDCYDDPA